MMNSAKQSLLALVVGFLLGSFLFSYAAPPKDKIPQIIRARTFEVVDEKGNTRASLSYQRGAIMLTLRDYNKNKQGNGGISLMVNSLGSQVLMSNIDNKTGIVISVPSEGEASITLGSKNGTDKVIKPE